MFNLKDKPWFRKFLISMVGKPAYKEYVKKSHDVKGTQLGLFNGMLRSCEETVFGKEHNFKKIKTYDDYKKALPVSHFEEHRPYIDRMMKGEADVLFPGKPIIYNTTSGTTSKPKMIPLSADFFRSGTSRMNKLWLYSALRDNPHIYDGKSLSYVAPAVEGHVEDGTPFGSVSGLAFKNIPSILKRTYSAPYPIVEIKNYDHKFYAMMRYALPENITIIIALNPSTYLRLHKTVMDEFDDLIKDIHDGTLREDVAEGIPADDREECLAWLQPRPERAKFLEKLMSEHKENLRPKHFWPDLALINLWKQGNFKQMLPKLDGFFPDKTVYRAFGYQASEGRAGLILGNDWDYSALASHAFFFEFIEEKDKELKDPPTLLAHELEEGKRYYLILNNLSGLYRYDMNDIIEVCGFYNQVPLFRFIQKGEGITNLTGEKLSEIQVIDAVRAVAGKKNIGVEYYTMYCDFDRQDYKFFIEYAPDTPENVKSSFAADLDLKLKEFNSEWEARRGTGRLDLPGCFELESNSQTLLKECLVKKGKAREAQYKNLYLTRKKDVFEELMDLRKKSH